jgi:hypothetical protein
MLRTAMIAVAIAVASAATTFAQNVTYDFDKSAQFSAYRTYAWVRGTTTLDEINDRRIVDAVNAQLASKSLIRIDATGSPDLLVAYHANFDRDLRITGFSSGWGGYRFAGSRSGVATTDQVVTGTHKVDNIDARTPTIVWRGRARREVSDTTSASKRDKNINQAAAKMFKHYPPAD